MAGLPELTPASAADPFARLDSGVRPAIRETVRRIVEGFLPQRVVLFGSHARGGAGPNSDLDLLVVMDVTGSKREARVAIRVALNGMGLPKDVVVATPEEVEKYRDLVGTIIRPALREGVVLYERPS